MLRLFIFISIFSVVFSVEAISKPKPKWKTVEVLKMVDNEHFMIKSQKVIKIIGISSPNIYIPKEEEKCLVRPIYRTLSNLLIGQKVKIFEDNYQDKNYEFPRHVKLSDGKILSEFLLEKGLSKFDKKYSDKKYLTKYQKAEKFAQKNKLGLWGGCNAWNKLKHRRKKSGKFLPFFSKYSKYLSDISVGKVDKILSGNSFQLENGLKVKLIGVAIPDIKKENLSCFSKKSQKYLENLILGRKVFLIRDKSQLDYNSFLLRYVYLAHDDAFVNKKVVQSGYGKSSWKTIDDKFKKEFNHIQQKIYKSPNGAWKSCIKDLLKNKNNFKKEPIIELAYDKNCRIKGNISGSKKSPKKTYHTPASGWYKRIKHEKCFEDEEEAIEARFIKVK